MKTPTESSQSPRMLSTTLATAFFSFSVVVLLLYAGVETLSDFKTQKAVVSSRQQLIAQDAAKTVRGFINENFSILETAIWLTNLDTASEEEQRQVLQSLLGLQSAFRHLVLLNARNRISAQSSRFSMNALKQFTERLKDFLPGQDRQARRTISPVYIDPLTSEPMVTTAVPVTNVFGDFKGTLIAELNLKSMWDIVDQLKVGETGYMYVSDRKGNLIAFHDTARVLKGENVSHVKAVSDFIQNRDASISNTAVRYQGIRGSMVVGTYTPLKTPEWAVVTEMPWEEAYRETLQGIVVSMGITLALAILAGIFGMFMARRLAAPVINLTETATRIAAGERDLQATIEGPREVARLAMAFNSMTAQLRQSLKELEQRFADLKRTGEALRLSEERLRLALEGTTDGIWDWNLKTGKVYFSPRYYTMLGYEADEFPPSYKSWRQLLHPADAEASEKAVKRAIEDHSAYAIEFRFKAKNGEWRWILGRGKVVESDKEGNAVRVAGSHTDITERKQAEAKIRESEEKYRFLIDRADVLVSVFDRNGICQLMNRKVAALFGGDPGDFIGKSLKELHPKAGEEYIRRLRRTIDLGISDEHEDEIEFPLGNRWLLSRSQPLPDAKGVFRIVQIISQDITERKQAEEALRSSQERLSLVIEGTNDGFWDWNVATGQAYFSSRYYTMLGYDPDEFPATYENWRNLIHPEDLAATEEKLRQHFEEKIPTYMAELRLKNRSGDYQWILIRGKVVERDIEGKVVRMAGTHSDITERKQAEEALRREKRFSDILIDSMPGVFYLFNEQGRFVRWNKRLESITGYFLEEIRHMKPTDFFSGEEKDYVERIIQEVLTKGESEAEASFTTKGGRTIPHHFTGLQIFIDGKPHVLGVGLDISDRKRAESQSARLQVLLKSVILQSPVPMALALPDGTVEMFNDSCRAVLGVEDELHFQAGMNLFTLEPSWKDYDAHGVYVPLTESPLAKALQGKATRGREIKVVRKNGTERWILVDAVPVHDESGEVMAGFLIFPDITERKQAEEALEKRIVALTRPLDTAEGIAFEDLFNLSEIQRLQDLYAKAFGVAALIMRPDGTPITQPSNFSELCGDIIRKTPKGVENCNRSDAMVGRHNLSGPNIQPCLSAGLCNAGVSITVGGHHVANWLIGQVRNEAQKEEEIMAYAREIGADETAFRAAYRKVPVMLQEQFERVAHVLFELANQISTTAYQNVQQARFIAERRRAEDALRKYERIVSSSQDLMALINTDYVYEAVNESFLRNLNKAREETIGSTVAKVMGEEVFRDKIQPQIDRALSGQIVHHQDIFDNPLSGWRVIEVTLFPMTDKRGKVEGVVLNARDITETRKLEEQLIQSQKIESVGTLAGGVAHEINNPINGIMNYAQLMLDRMESENPAREFAQEILHETQRIGKIVRNLLTFARDEKHSHSPAHFSDIINSVLSLIQTLIRRDQIDLHVEISEDLPKIKCRSQQIQQVLMNLVTNARDALNDRYPGYDPEKKLRVFTERIMKQDRDFIRTTVEDAGNGIPVEIQERIFDPFFTTKPKEKGTGLGLSISYGIVKDHGGELIVESEKGRYTRFHMDLPVDNGWKL